MVYRGSSFYGLDKIAKVVPTVNPDWISRLGVALALPILFLSEVWAMTLLLFVSLVLDWLDGVMARRLKKNDPHVDLGCDRATEFTLIARFPVLLPVVMFNVFASVFRTKKDLPLIIPLRQLLFIYFLSVSLGLLPWYF